MQSDYIEAGLLDLQIWREREANGPLRSVKWVKDKLPVKPPFFVSCTNSFKPIIQIIPDGMSSELPRTPTPKKILPKDLA